MFFFSTPLWRRPTPIVHKINPRVQGDPVQRLEHACTVCNSCIVLYTYDQIHSTAQHNTAWEASQHGNHFNTFLENPSSEESMLIKKTSHMFCFFFLSLLFFPASSCPAPHFSEGGKLYRTLTSPNWLWLGGLVDILKWFMLKVERLGSAPSLGDSHS